MSDRINARAWVSRQENGAPRFSGRTSEDDREACRAQTRDGRDERLRHRPWTGAESLAYEMGREAVLLASRRGTVVGTMVRTNTKTSAMSAQETHMKTQNTNEKAQVVKSEKTAKVAPEAKQKAAPKVAPNNQKKVRKAFALKTGRVKDKQYLFEGTETDSISEVLELVKINIRNAKEANIREIIISVR